VRCQIPDDLHRGFGTVNAIGYPKRASTDAPIQATGVMPMGPNLDEIKLGAFSTIVGRRDRLRPRARGGPLWSAAT
jgi:hypothetical protein